MKMDTNELGLNEKGDEVMKQSGVLKQATDLLNELSKDDKENKEEIGSWLTILGRALLAVFK